MSTGAISPLVDANVVDEHLLRPRVRVDPLGSAPVAADGEVEDDVEVLVVRPAVVARVRIVVGEVRVAVDRDRDLGNVGNRTRF